MIPPAAAALATHHDKEELRQALEILDRVGNGETVAQAAQALGISRQTAFRRMRLVEVDANTGVIAIMRASGERVLHDWLTASQVAANKGDHRPARDMLLYSGQVEELQGDKRNAAQVLIQIGSPESPIQALAPQVIEAERVSPPEPDSSS